MKPRVIVEVLVVLTTMSKVSSSDFAHERPHFLCARQGHSWSKKAVFFKYNHLSDNHWRKLMPKRVVLIEPR